MAEFTQWTNYLDVQAAMASAHEAAAEASHKNAVELSMLSSDAKPMTAKAQARQTEEVKELEAAHQVAHARRRLLERLFNGCERNAALCSRELTRRTSVAPRERTLGKHTP